MRCDFFSRLAYHFLFLFFCGGMHKITEYVLGVDVGTGSVRAALVNRAGKVLKVTTEPIKTWNPKPDFYLQSSDDIWSACCTAVKAVTNEVSAYEIKGIGFDATCSLAVFDKQSKPLKVYPKGEDYKNIILWMDHRAMAETEFINNTQHPILQYTGGKISCEMVMAKLRWLKNNMFEDCWKKAAHFFLLPDFLTWKATLSQQRSLCSLVCKCNYEASPRISRWNEEFFKAIGMPELSENNWERIGSGSINPGEKCGLLTEVAARELGLITGIPVASSLIDAHAGGLALMGCKAPGIKEDFVSKIALICGTSTCHMAVSKTELFVPGVWGPYYNAMVPDNWLIEGGQSASGKLVDYIIECHPSFPAIRQKLSNINVTEYLNNLLNDMVKNLDFLSVDELTKDLHVYPDFHGNRSPISDPTLKGMISGLSLSCGEEDLAILYLATLQALVYSTKHILEQITEAGHEKFECMLICGGLSRNKLFLQLHANAIGIPVLSPVEPEIVLLGASMLAAGAAQFYKNLKDVMFNMSSPATYVQPDKQTFKYHSKKYAVFLELLKHQEEYKKIMSE